MWQPVAETVEAANIADHAIEVGANPQLSNQLPQVLARLDDASRLSGLTACLRLAEYLERSRSGRIKGLRTEINSNKVRLSLLATEEPLVEIWEARKHAPLFKRAFGKKLVLTTELID